nr:MAG TPA: hypothetical protein [Caudoviricetes sp.]
MLRTKQPRSLKAPGFYFIPLFSCFSGMGFPYKSKKTVLFDKHGISK